MLKILNLIISTCLVFLVSCGDLENKDATAQLASEVSQSQPKAWEMYNKGQDAVAKGKTKDAAKTYDLLAKKHPTFEKSAEANFLAGQYWESINQPQAAFESYEHYIKTFRNGKMYSDALMRQSDIAFSAAQGGLNKKFIGLSSEVPHSTVVSMLSQVRNNAPASSLAAKAQFEIGAFLESKDKGIQAAGEYFKVADTFPGHSLAPEATFRAGKLLAGYSTSGNQNSSNLKRAKRTLEDVIQQYPGSSQAKEAKTVLSQISGTDLGRTFDVAQFYEKKGKVSSAKYYYQEVMNKTSAGNEYHEKAKERLNAL